MKHFGFTGKKKLYHYHLLVLVKVTGYVKRAQDLVRTYIIKNFELEFEFSIFFFLRRRFGRYLNVLHLHFNLNVI